jgi:hypothetical protein
MAAQMQGGTSSLSDRIMGAFMFRREVYADVEKDTSFTTTAWLIVVVVSFLQQLGSNAGEGIGRWLIATVIGTVFAVVAFAIGALVINWVGRTVFNADVTYEELVRTLGLAHVWNVIGVVGALASFSTALVCILSPAFIIGGILGLIAWFVAAKEALDLEWVQTIVTVILGWLVVAVVFAISATIIAVLGFGAAAVTGALTP